MTTDTKHQMEMIRASAFDEQELLTRAFMDAIEQFAKTMIRNRTAAESIRLMHNWQGTFQRMEKKP